MTTPEILAIFEIVLTGNTLARSYNAAVLGSLASQGLVTIADHNSELPKSKKSLQFYSVEPTELGRNLDFPELIKSL